MNQTLTAQQARLIAVLQRFPLGLFPAVFLKKQTHIYGATPGVGDTKGVPKSQIRRLLEVLVPYGIHIVDVPCRYSSGRMGMKTYYGIGTFT